VMSRVTRHDRRGRLCEGVDLFRHHREVLGRRELRPRVIYDRRAQITDCALYVRGKLSA
jgi:hypothetical protein